MSQLFGSNSPSFYSRYNELLLSSSSSSSSSLSSSSLTSDGYRIRKVIYNLYHILNHYVLFGGSGYLNQANSMIDTILKAWNTNINKYNQYRLNNQEESKGSINALDEVDNTQGYWSIVYFLRFSI